MTNQQTEEKVKNIIQFKLFLLFLDERMFALLEKMLLKDVYIRDSDGWFKLCGTNTKFDEQLKKLNSDPCENCKYNQRKKEVNAK